MKNKHWVPYVSFILCGRNDNHGGNFVERLNTCLRVIDTLSFQYQLACEIILVEWNPPADTPPLEKVVCKPRQNPYLDIVIYCIPHAIHQEVAGEFPYPLLEWRAKNTGAIRSKGEFILITNPDIIMSEELFQKLATQQLKKDAFYRALRKDSTPLSESSTMTIREIYTLCKQNILRIHGLYGQEEKNSHNILSCIKKKCGRLVRILLKALLPNYRLFTNAAGDFLLTHRDNFFRMRGYPEIQKHSFIDGYACYLLHNQGLREHVFKNNECIYHQDHSRPHKKGLLSYRISLLFIILHKIITFNKNDTWGLQKYRFPPTRIHSHIGKKILGKFYG